MTKPIVVKGQAYWSYLNQVNPMSDRYQMDICNLDKDTAKQLKAAGLNVRKDPDKKPEQGYYITAKTLQPPRVMNSDKSEFDKSQRLGNGSEVKVAIKPVEYDNKFGSGVTAGLGAIMVTKLVQAYDDGADLLDAETMDDSFIDDDFDDEDLD